MRKVDAVFLAIAMAYAAFMFGITAGTDMTTASVLGEIVAYLIPLTIVWVIARSAVSWLSKRKEAKQTTA